MGEREIFEQINDVLRETDTTQELTDLWTLRIF